VSPIANRAARPPAGVKIPATAPGKVCPNTGDTSANRREAVHGARRRGGLGGLPPAPYHRLSLRGDLMSSTFDVYAVADERLKQVVGSRDKALADAIVASQEHLLSSVDEIDEESELKAADALRELIDGQLSGDGGGYLYGYALKAICAHIGQELPEISGVAGASDWMNEVDGVLESKGLPMTLNALVYGGSPVEIPEPDDYPFIGKWDASKVPAALASFRAADLSDVEDDEIAETITQMRQWLEAAAQKAGTSLIGFLY
jgi:hypothetical protein